jgi:hypothetical protein
VCMSGKGADVEVAKCRCRLERGCATRGDVREGHGKQAGTVIHPHR